MPVSCTPATVRVFCTDFTSLDDPTIQAFIDASSQVCTSAALGTQQGLMQIYLVGHFLALAHPELYQGGSITGETVGQVSRQYQAGTPLNQSELNLTRYGAEYKRLLRSTGFGFMSL